MSTKLVATGVQFPDTTVLTSASYINIPAGVILLWSGSIASIPIGWALCDGANGTPNLLDRFIVGAGSGYGVGATGGSADATLPSHTHSINDPGHLHSINYRADLAGATGGYNIAGGPATQNTNSATTGISVNSAGTSATNANLPPYYALAYIMKL